jgi:hypothetical protein
MSKVRVEPVVSDGWLNLVQMDNFLCISQLVCKWLTSYTHNIHIFHKISQPYGIHVGRLPMKRNKFLLGAM